MYAVMDLSEPTTPDSGLDDCEQVSHADLNSDHRFGAQSLPDPIVVRALDTYRMVNDRVARRHSPARSRDLIESLHLGDADGVSRFVAGAWTMVAQAMSRDPAHAAELVPLLSRLRNLESSVESFRHNLADDLLARTNDAVDRLSQCGSSGELIREIPRQGTKLGFDRMLFSAVSGSRWRPQSIHSLDKSDWANRYITDQLHAGFRVPSAANLGRTAHVNGATMAELRDRESGFALWQQSKSRDFWMVPIVAEHRLVGMIHADCFLHERRPSRTEVAALQRFCQQLSLILGHRVAMDALRTASSTMTTTSTTAQVQRRAIGEKLSQREVDVVRLMAEGFTNAQIGRRLCITEGTVKSHVKRILKKTASANRAEAVAYWFRHQPAVA